MSGGWTGYQGVPKHLRTQVLQRDGYRCYIDRSHRATEVDHIIPRYLGGTDALANLGAICGPCHRIKSSHEGADARRRKRALRLRPTTPHPGLRG